MRLFFAKCIVLVMLYPCAVLAEDWTPQPGFSIEGSSYKETLIFVAGLSYGLVYSDKELRNKGLVNFYCYPAKQGVDSKVLFDLLNEKLSGDHRSEEVIETVMAQLKEKYPC